MPKLKVRNGARLRFLGAVHFDPLLIWSGGHISGSSAAIIRRDLLCRLSLDKSLVTKLGQLAD